MITCILSTSPTVEPPSWTFISISIVSLIAILAYGAIFALIIIGLIRLVRFLGSAGKEMKLTRMEVGKLAEEVHLMRQELKGGEKGNSSTKSG
jgi:hypothetical protein